MDKQDPILEQIISERLLPLFYHDDVEVCLSVVKALYINKILWIPGGMTATEIQQAENAGCTLIKLFPGYVWGPFYIPAIKPLFHNLGFVVTGGVKTSKENLSAWFKGGAAGVGPGNKNKLITNKVPADKDQGASSTVTKEVLNRIQSFKKTAII